MSKSKHIRAQLATTPGWWWLVGGGREQERHDVVAPGHVVARRLSCNTTLLSCVPHIPCRHTTLTLDSTQHIHANNLRKRYFSVKQAYEEGLVDKLVPGYKMNRSVGREGLRV